MLCSKYNNTFRSNANQRCSGIFRRYKSPLNQRRQIGITSYLPSVYKPNPNNGTNLPSTFFQQILANTNKRRICHNKIDLSLTTIPLIRSDISSILLKWQHHFLRQKTFEMIVLKMGARPITPDKLIICQIHLCETNDLLLVYLHRFIIF